jgi:hypothetical protein
MGMDDLIIVQLWNMLCYAIIQGCDYWLWVCRFELGDYVYM